MKFFLRENGTFGEPVGNKHFPIKVAAYYVEQWKTTKTLHDNTINCIVLQHTQYNITKAIT